MDSTITLTPAMMALVPVVALLMEVAKKLPYYNKIQGYSPVLAMGIGVGLAVASSVANPVIAGILIGIASSYGYDVFKTVKKERK